MLSVTLHLVDMFPGATLSYDIFRLSPFLMTLSAITQNDAPLLQFL